jgi:hypothetical protein
MNKSIRYMDNIFRFMDNLEKARQVMIGLRIGLHGSVDYLASLVVFSQHGLARLSDRRCLLREVLLIYLLADSAGRGAR